MDKKYKYLYIEVGRSSSSDDNGVNEWLGPKPQVMEGNRSKRKALLMSMSDGLMKELDHLDKSSGRFVESSSFV